MTRSVLRLRPGRSHRPHPRIGGAERLVLAVRQLAAFGLDAVSIATVVGVELCWVVAILEERRAGDG